MCVINDKPFCRRNICCQVYRFRYGKAQAIEFDQPALKSSIMVSWLQAPFANIVLSGFVRFANVLASMLANVCEVLIPE